MAYGDGDQVFTPEQVTAMMLTYLKSVAEKALGKPVVDCVVSVSGRRLAYNYQCYVIYI